MLCFELCDDVDVETLRLQSEYFEIDEETGDISIKSNLGGLIVEMGEEQALNKQLKLTVCVYSKVMTFIDMKQWKMVKLQWKIHKTLIHGNLKKSENTVKNYM